MAVFGKARYIKRVEDGRLRTDTGGFTDNLTRPNQAYDVLVRSPHAFSNALDDSVLAKTIPLGAQPADAGNARSHLAGHPGHEALTRRR